MRYVAPLNVEGVLVVIRPSCVNEYRKRWLVSVGVNRYWSQTYDLTNAVNDACAVYRRLIGEFAFTGMLLCRNDDVENFDPAMETCVVGNGTQADILEAIDEIAKSSTEDDLFVFFYSGHATDDGSGYMIPYGAVNGNHATYLMYETFFGALTALPCMHKLLLFDGCFAGITTRGEKLVREPAGDDVPPQTRGAIELGEKTVVIAATSAFDIALDSFQSFHSADTGSSKHSPFTHALLRTMDEMAPGTQVLPAWIYNRVFIEVSQLVPDNHQQPRMYEAGYGLMLLKRPGIRIDVAERLYYSSQPGVIVSVTLVAEGGAPPYEWSIDAPIDGMGIVAETLRLQLDQLELGSNAVMIRVCDREGVTASKDLQVIVTAASALAIRTRSLTPCVKGEDYRIGIDAVGGKPPLRFQVEGLPQGLVHVAESGWIFGLIPEGTGDRCTHSIEVTVTDEAGQQVGRSLRLITLSRMDYCEIPEGPFQVGYHPSQARVRELRRQGVEDLDPSRSHHLLPQGTHYLPRYFIKRYPVTNQEWKAFLDDSGHHAIPLSWPDGFYQKRIAGLPVAGVSVTDMQAYCDWRGTRLPNGLEWEKAARGSDGRLYPWGDRYDPNRCNGTELGWHDLTCVDQFPSGASPYGVMDMAGNLRECVRQYIPTSSREVWRCGLRGGGFNQGGASLPSCFAQRGFRNRMDSVSGRLTPTDGGFDPAAGFRDVIEIQVEPPYPQGFVGLAPSGFPSPSSHRERTTQSVYIARYAVSNEEYAAFVSDTGHRRPMHWRQSGETFYADEDRHLPVVNVSFEDAAAFCNWLSFRVFQRYDEIRVLPQRLWEIAVHGPGLMIAGFEPRDFPWGAQFDPLRCNCRESGWGGALRVFEIPQGQAACGAFNLVGNVWEWVAPGLVAGGSWRDECHAHAGWFETCEGARCDVGFRYYSKQPAPATQ